MARVDDYFLGGAHNFAVDRELAARIEQSMPGVAYVARLNRSFLRRVVSFMVDHGIRQFLDIGSGIPTVRNVHEIAQQADPACRVVYVDKEPIAIEHSRILLRGNDRVSVIHADRARITTLFDGFELVPPGVSACAAWRPEGLGDGYLESDSNTLVYAGVGHVR